MKKIGAQTILLVMLVPVLGWAATTLIDHQERIARVEEKEKSLKENVIEIKNDVKYIRLKLEN